MQELTKKIEDMLKAKFPDYSKQELDEMMDDYGEIALLELLRDTIELLPDDASKKEFGDLFGQAKTEDAITYAKTKGVDMGEIFEKIGKSIMMEILE